MAKVEVPTGEKAACVVLVVALGAVVYLTLGGGLRSNRAASQVLPEGWRLVDGWHRYSADRLYEKIDGRAAVFQEYAVRRLEFATASIDGLDFDVYWYDMGSTDGAMGVYFEESPQESTKLSFGRMADRSGGMVRAVQGRYYLVVLSLGRSGGEDRAVELAKGLLDRLEPAVGPAEALIDLLPQRGRITGSLAYNKTSAFGLKSLAKTFSAAYDRDGTEFNLFVRRISPKAVAKVIRAIADELRAFDAKDVTVNGGRLGGTLLGQTLCLIHRDGALYGIYGEVSREKAWAALEAVATGKDR